MLTSMQETTRSHLDYPVDFRDFPKSLGISATYTHVTSTSFDANRLLMIRDSLNTPFDPIHPLQQKRCRWIIQDSINQILSLYSVRIYHYIYCYLCHFATYNFDKCQYL